MCLCRSAFAQCRTGQYAGGIDAARQDDADGIFVPSWKIPDGLVIGQSKAAGKTDWMTYVPAVKIQYQWVSTDNPNDVTPPANDYIRTGRAYTAKAQQNSHQGYTFDSWYTDTTCTVPYVNGTVLNTEEALTLSSVFLVLVATLSIS